MSLTPQALVNYVLRHMSVTTYLCSRQQHEHGYTMQRRIIQDYNFIYVTRGKVIWAILQENHVLTPGELVIVPPGIEHHAYSLTPQCTVVSVHVEARLPGGQDVFALLSPPRQQSIPPESRLHRYFCGSRDEWDRPSSAEVRLFQPGWAHLITWELFRSNAESGLLRCRASDPLISAMLEDLDKRLAEPVSLGELAKKSGFSAQHLNRIFRQTLGVTPLQYLSRARMEHAAALLRDGRLTVRAVGRQVGFDDAYYFSRMFKAYHGRSPMEFRQAIAAE
ncbi:MAG TPA: AraC family transcriptional regulator [Planctomycetota bacterium]|nr:AraC family transcriptional regulator [Planctomycetota bacterium]